MAVILVAHQIIERQLQLITHEDVMDKFLNTLWTVSL